MRPVRCHVALALFEGLALHRRLVLNVEDVHLRVREVGQSAGMVEVEVRQHDVAHVVSTKAQALHLPDRSLLGIENRPNRGLEVPSEGCRGSRPWRHHRIGGIAPLSGRAQRGAV